MRMSGDAIAGTLTTSGCGGSERTHYHRETLELRYFCPFWYSREIRIVRERMFVVAGNESSRPMPETDREHFVCRAPVAQHV